MSCGGYQMNFWVEFQKHVGSPIYGVQDYPECIFLTDQMADTAIEPWDHGTRWAMAGTCARVPSCVSACAVCRVPRATCRGPNNLISWWLLITDPGGQLLSGTAMSEDPNKVTGDNIIPGNTGRRSWSQNVKQNNEWMNETDKVHAATLEWAQWL